MSRQNNKKFLSLTVGRQSRRRNEELKLLIIMKWIGTDFEEEKREYINKKNRFHYDDDRINSKVRLPSQDRGEKLNYSDVGSMLNKYSIRDFDKNGAFVIDRNVKVVEISVTGTSGNRRYSY